MNQFEEGKEAMADAVKEYFKPLKYLWWIIKCFTGFGNVEDGSICWFSKKFYDVHDYPIHKGGSGVPDHNYNYQCRECGKEFRI